MRKNSINSDRVPGRSASPTRRADRPQEEGSFVLFSTLMILVLLTLTGVAATKMANTEISIAGNEAARNINVYRAEAGAVEAAMRIADESNAHLKITDSELNPDYPEWMTYHSDIDPGAMADSANWDFDGEGDDNAAVSAFDDVNVQFAVVDRGVARGSSLIMTGGEQKREYQVYGLSDSVTGSAMVEIGYRKRLL